MFSDAGMMQEVVLEGRTEVKRTRRRLMFSSSSGPGQKRVFACFRVTDSLVSSSLSDWHFLSEPADTAGVCRCVCVGHHLWI